jgi:hypothetical protein
MHTRSALLCSIWPAGALPAATGSARVGAHALHYMPQRAACMLSVAGCMGLTLETHEGESIKGLDDIRIPLCQRVMAYHKHICFSGPHPCPLSSSSLGMTAHGAVVCSPRLPTTTMPYQPASPTIQCDLLFLPCLLVAECSALWEDPQLCSCFLCCCLSLCIHTVQAPLRLFLPCLELPSVLPSLRAYAMHCGDCWVLLCTNLTLTCTPLQLLQQQSCQHHCSCPTRLTEYLLPLNIQTAGRF